MLPEGLALVLVVGVAGCGDVYCQGGPRYGTQCYPGMTVRERDPLAPVAPLPPLGHQASRDAGPPVMLPPAKVIVMTDAASSLPIR